MPPYRTKPFIGSDFVNQLEYSPEYGEFGDNQTMPFHFPRQNLTVSVQAGAGKRSEFVIDGELIDYWNFVAHSRTSEIWNPDSTENRGSKERRLLPLSCATRFEVAIYKPEACKYLSPRDLGLSRQYKAWESGSIGNFISKSGVQWILNSLHCRENRLLSAYALVIQRHYRGWIVRKRIAWDINTTIGYGLKMMEIRRHCKNNISS